MGKKERVNERGQDTQRHKSKKKGENEKNKKEKRNMK